MNNLFGDTVFNEPQEQIFLLPNLILTTFLAYGGHYVLVVLGAGLLAWGLVKHRRNLSITGGTLVIVGLLLTLWPR